jgi:hypothetical protein
MAAPLVKTRPCAADGLCIDTRVSSPSIPNERVIAAPLKRDRVAGDTPNIKPSYGDAMSVINIEMQGPSWRR